MKRQTAHVDEIGKWNGIETKWVEMTMRRIRETMRLFNWMESLAITIVAIRTLFVNELNATGHECGHAVWPIKGIQTAVPYYAALCLSLV